MSTSVPTLNVVVASTRPGRSGEQIGRWFTGVARAQDAFDVRVIDLAELRLPFLDEPLPAVEGEPYEHEHTRFWSELTASADAFVFVMPEYNQGYTAPLKNALDFLYSEWVDKPVAFVSYGMKSGGLRAVQAIKPVVSALKMMPIEESVTIHLRQTMKPDGEWVPTAALHEAAIATLDELLRVSRVFAALRAHHGMAALDAVG